MRGLICIITFCVSVSACASSISKKQPEEHIVHVVLIWLQDSGNTEHVKKIIQATRELKDIPEIQEIRVGNSIPSDRKIVDDSFDVGLYMIFKSQEEMQHYLVHPKHKQVVQDTLRPFASKIVVYDFFSTN